MLLVETASEEGRRVLVNDNSGKAFFYIEKLCEFDDSYFRDTRVEELRLAADRFGSKRFWIICSSIDSERCVCGPQNI